jgi:hypothetical protein
VEHRPSEARRCSAACASETLSLVRRGVVPRPRRQGVRARFTCDRLTTERPAWLHALLHALQHPRQVRYAHQTSPLRVLCCTVSPHCVTSQSRAARTLAGHFAATKFARARHGCARATRPPPRAAADTARPQTRDRPGTRACPDAHGSGGTLQGEPALATRWARGRTTGTATWSIICPRQHEAAWRGLTRLTFAASARLRRLGRTRRAHASRMRPAPRLATQKDLAWTSGS